MPAKKSVGHSSGRKILENKFATLWYHPDAKIVHHEIHQPIMKEPFRQLLTQGAELFGGRHLGLQRLHHDIEVPADLVAMLVQERDKLGVHGVKWVQWVYAR